MSIVFIVDADASGLAKDFNAIAKRERVEFKFKPLLSPDQMFGELQHDPPDLVLLHHNWSGVSITDILNRLERERDQCRVIVFTGRPVKIHELIECVRLGVADYWTKGALEPAGMFRKITH